MKATWNLLDHCKEVAIQCEDGAERVVFMKRVWGDGDVDYELNFEDAYCGGGYTGIFGRLKRAWHAFRTKPIYYSGIYIEEPQRVRRFLEDCLKLMDDEIGV